MAQLAPKKKTWAQNHLTQRNLAPYIFVSPFVVTFLVFGLYPILFSLYFSLQDWYQLDGWGDWKFVGLQNFKNVLTETDFIRSTINTFAIGVISGIPQHLIAIPLAFVIHHYFKRYKTWLTGIYFLPYITATVAIVLVFSTMFSTNYGLINQTIASMNKWPILGALLPDENINWYRSSYIRWLISTVVIWKYTGWNTLLYLSAMQAIPQDLYEAAEVDGASRFQMFRRITLPLLRPMMFFAITLTLIGNLQLFEEPYVVLGGIANGAGAEGGKTMAMYMFLTAFQEFKFGKAAATVWIMLLMIVGLTLLNNKIFGKDALGRVE